MTPRLQFQGTARTGNGFAAIFKLCVPPGDVQFGPDEGTATAQAYPRIRRVPLKDPHSSIVQPIELETLVSRVARVTSASSHPLVFP